MALYNLNLFDLKDISTTAAGFDDNGGYQFAAGVDTITIGSGALSQIITVSDPGDGTFDDDAGIGQTLASSYTINGNLYAAGTIIESEYHLIVRDSLGNDYTIQFVSLNDDAFHVRGFVVQGTMPPWNQPLTVMSAHDMAQGVNPYATSTPACFEASVLILTDRGPVAASNLRPCDLLVKATGGTIALRLAINQRVQLGPDTGDTPIRISAHALGAARPSGEVVLSRQHRVYLPAAGVLVPAHALTDMPGVAPVSDLAQIDYVHLVTAPHTVILAQGLPCETFWPGRIAMEGLPPPTLAAIRRIMGAAPIPAAPMVSAGYYRRVLAPAAEPRRMLAPG